jgi:urease accessory protein
MASCFAAIRPSGCRSRSAISCFEGHAVIWRIWQLADSAFPSGGFAHSGGLEAALQQGEVRGAEGFRRFLLDSLWQAGRGSMPMANASFDDRARLAEADGICDAFLNNPVANRASRVQGRTFFSACLRAIGGSELRSLEQEIRARGLAQHHAPLFGATLAALGVERELMQRLVLHLAMRGVVSGAVRLGVIGPYQGQSIQWELAPELEAILKACGELGLEDVSQTAPLLDLLQGNHDRLYSRLFQS